MNLGLVLHGRFSCGDESVTAGMLFGRPPGMREPTRVDRSQPYHDFLLIVGGEAVQRLADLDLLPLPGFRMAVGAPATAAGLFRRLMTDLPEGPCHVADGIATVATMMRRVLTLRRRDLDVPAAVLDEAARILDAQCAARHGEEALVASLGVPWGQLRRAFTAHHGIPPHRYRIRSRIAKACAMLATQPVGEVAAALGYPDAFCFSRQFSQWMGVPPSRWRQVPR
jgi:AraC-like DNA-binding protein